MKSTLRSLVTIPNPESLAQHLAQAQETLVVPVSPPAKSEETMEPPEQIIQKRLECLEQKHLVAVDEMQRKISRPRHTILPQS